MIDFLSSFFSFPERFRTALGNFLLASPRHWSDSIINHIFFNENDGTLIGNLGMRVFPNYLLTFKSDIHRGTTEQDWCLNIRKFFQGAFYKKNLMTPSRLPPRGDIFTLGA